MKNYGASMFMGETTRGVPSPFFYDPHTQVWNNLPPTTIVTGAPGSGKTFFALTCAAISTICNKSTIVLDPKGDFLSLLEIKDSMGGKFNLIDMGAGKAGIMDPFYMSSDPDEIHSMVIEVIDLFAGGLSDEQYTALAPIILDTMRLEIPSLLKVVDMLTESDNPVSKNLGTKLMGVKRMKFGSLCFAPGNKSRKILSIDDGLTVITLLGLELPATPDEARATAKGRLASGLLYLIMNFVKKTIEGTASLKPKTLIIDETWAIAATEQGARAIQSCALLGRSKNLATILITQNMSHLQHLDINSTVSTQIAFRSDAREGVLITKEMKLPEGEGFEGIITHLENGECLVKDYMDRYSTVQISQWRQDWKEAFETNPMEKLRKLSKKDN